MAATGGQIAEFFGTLGFKVDQRDIQRFDRTLTQLERRAQSFTQNALKGMRVTVSGYQFSPQFNDRLRKGIQAQVNRASKGISIKVPNGTVKISKFVYSEKFDERIKMSLQSKLNGAARRIKLKLPYGVAEVSSLRFVDGFDEKAHKKLQTRLNVASRGLKVNVPKAVPEIQRFSFASDFNTRLYKALKARMNVATKEAFKPNIKFGKVTVPIAHFKFSDDFTRRLHTALGARLKAASTRQIAPTITLNKFDVDREALLREMRDAVRYVENNLRVRVRSDVQHPSMGSQGVSGGGSGGIASRTAMGAGLGAGAASLGRGFVPGLGFAFGVSQLNQQVQQIKGQELAAQAILGSQEAGTATMQWLRDFSEEAGVDYRRQGQAYNNMLASGTQIGMQEEEVQGIFAGVTRYGRTYGLNSEQMRGGMKAIEQMLN